MAEAEAGDARAQHPVGPRFPLGRVVATPGALDALNEARQGPMQFLRRHVRGDWGEVSANDAAANNDAVGRRERILSAYTLRTGQRILVQTEANRSATTLMLPIDY